MGMLLRRHKNKKEQQAKEIEEVTVEIDYKELKVDELKALLDDKAIEYDAKNKKDDLIALLKDK